MSQKLRQVTLRRDHNMYYQEDVCWIDERFAVVGKTVRDEDGRHWKVWDVHGVKTTKDLERDYRTWRKFAEVLDGH